MSNNQLLESPFFVIEKNNNHKTTSLIFSVFHVFVSVFYDIFFPCFMVFSRLLAAPEAQRVHHLSPGDMPKVEAEVLSCGVF